MEIEEIQTSLIRWFTKEGRQLPWRETTDPYRILVSELMLQQTQVKTVLDFYRRWMERFPTLEHLAAAEESEVLHAWQGLGYYRRARSLHQCAKELAGRSFPRTVEELRALPGIGRYTAGAVLSFAFDLPAPIVDGNVGRVLTRLFNIKTPIESSKAQTQIWSWAEALVQSEHPRLLNSALMELGALVCVPRKPDCARCPIGSHCRASDPEQLPIKKKGVKITAIAEHYLWVQRDGALLLELQRGKRWKGLWCLPKVTDDTTILEKPLVTLTHSITRYRVNLEVYKKELSETVTKLETPLPGTTWVAMDQLECFPMPAPHRKAIALTRKILVDS